MTIRDDSPLHWSHKAYMSVRDADLVERILFHMQRRTGSFRVLEWGAGRSTAYFPPVLAAVGNVTWLAVEHDPEWAAKVRKDTLDFPYVHMRERKRWDDYTTQCGAAIDVAIVDGRMRRRCLLDAVNAQLVILHDAQRPYYHCAFASYTSHRMIGEMLWIGSNRLDTATLMSTLGA